MSQSMSVSQTISQVNHTNNPARNFNLSNIRNAKNFKSKVKSVLRSLGPTKMNFTITMLWNSFWISVFHNAVLLWLDFMIINDIKWPHAVASKNKNMDGQTN